MIMYEAKNPSDLKKFLKEGKSPIVVIDKNMIKLIEAFESIKQKGFFKSVTEKVKETFAPKPLNAEMGVITGTEGLLIALGISAATAISCYALYKGKNVRIVRKPDGTIVLETSN